MKTRKNYKSLLNEARECIWNESEHTKVRIELEVNCCGEPSGINVFPANDSGMISGLNDIVDFCRVKRLSNYCYMTEVNGQRVCAVAIF
jgi:hypothetical protein